MATGKKISQLDAQNEELTADDLLEGEDVSLSAGTRSRKITFKKLQGLYINEKSTPTTDTIAEDEIGGIIELNPAAITTYELPTRSTTGTKGQITTIVNVTSNDHTINQNSGESGNRIRAYGTAGSSFFIAAGTVARLYDNGTDWILI